MTQEENEPLTQEQMQSQDLTDERGKEDSLSMEGSAPHQASSNPTREGEGRRDSGANKSFLKSVKSSWDKVPQAWGQQRTSKE